MICEIETLPEFIPPFSKYDDGTDTTNGGVGEALLSHAFVPYLAAKGLTCRIRKPTTSQDAQEASDRLLDVLSNEVVIFEAILQAKYKNHAERDIIWVEMRRGEKHAGWAFKKHPTKEHWLLDLKHRPNGTRFYFGVKFSILQKKMVEIWGEEVLDIYNYETIFKDRIATSKEDCVVSLIRNGIRKWYPRWTESYNEEGNDALIPLLLTDFGPDEAFTIEVPNNV